MVGLTSACGLLPAGQQVNFSFELAVAILVKAHQVKISRCYPGLRRRLQAAGGWEAGLPGDDADPRSSRNNANLI